jgi:hypothetical protein
MRYLLFICIAFTHNLLIAQQQSDSLEHWRGIKISLQHTVSILGRSDLEYVNSDGSGVPVGIVTPAFVWGKGREKWNELSMPALTLNRTEDWTYSDTSGRSLRGSLTTKYQTGLRFLRARPFGLRRLPPNFPLYLVYGLGVQTGRYALNTQRADIPNRTATAQVIDLPLGLRMAWRTHHFYIDYGVYTLFQCQIQQNNFQSTTPGNSTVLQFAFYKLTGHLSVGYVF